MKSDGFKTNSWYFFCEGITTPFLKGLRPDLKDLSAKVCAWKIRSASLVFSIISPSLIGYYNDTWYLLLGLPIFVLLWCTGFVLWNLKLGGFELHLVRYSVCGFGFEDFDWDFDIANIKEATKNSIGSCFFVFSYHLR